MAISQDKLEKLIAEGFPEAEFKILDLAGDGDHYKLVISSTKFQGLSMVQQHKMVYKALEGYIGDKLHALALETHVKN